MSDDKACVPLRKRFKTIESTQVTDSPLGHPANGCTSSLRRLEKPVESVSSCSVGGYPAKYGFRHEKVKDNPGEDLNWEWQEKLRKLLLCPVCYVTIRPSVKICENGHSVCKECRMSLQNCPLCYANFTETRNVMLAQIAEYVKYPCLNAKGGCPEMCYLRDEKSHLRCCPYRSHSCKVEACRWTGSKSDLRVHVETLHRDNVWERGWYFSETAELNPKCPSSRRKLLIVHNEIFWIFLKYNPGDRKLYRNIQYIGTKETAERFWYQICLKSSDDRRGYQFRSVMDDDTLNGNSVFDSPTCATIDDTVLRCLSLSSNQRVTIECHYSLKRC